MPLPFLSKTLHRSSQTPLLPPISISDPLPASTSVRTSANSLPPELLRNVFFYLIDNDDKGGWDILSCCLVCPRWCLVLLPNLPGRFRDRLDAHQFTLSELDRLCLYLSQSQIGRFQMYREVRIDIPAFIDLSQSLHHKKFNMDLANIIARITRTMGHFSRLHIDCVYATPPKLYSIDHISSFSSLRDAIIPHCLHVEQLTLRHNLSAREFSFHTFLAGWIERLPRLRAVHFTEGYLFTLIQSALCHHKAIEIADFKGNATLSSLQAMKLLTRWPQLTEIDLTGTPSTDDAVLSFLARICLNLRMVRVPLPDHIVTSVAPTPSTLRRLLRACARHLHVLDLSHHVVGVDDSCLRVMAESCTQLRSLTLAGCSRVKGRSDLRLAWPRLEALDLWGCDQVPAAFVRKIVLSCPKLKMIRLPAHLNNDEELVRMMEEQKRLVLEVDEVGTKWIAMESTME
ncbi:hypothetical protein BC937DRAFT_89518 [Endogone sp. FLAS-F59071]|nr:hypothetical protein BC937DRAFT_89518 [Endogone sp. FLAS-F59071]|eukprot:RUS17764.1 hypothetical protein BC937DRAFT_89518 [Endogone sp. FLAS-F59071]